MLGLFNRHSQLLFAPEEKGGSAGVITPDSKEDIIKFLGEEDEKPEILDLDTKKEEKPEKEEKEEKEEPGEKEEEKELDELKELEAETEEPTEEQLELTTPVRRQEILKKYPTLFKDFPYLEKAYYREQQFTEFFPTMDDAKQAIDKVQILDNFERDLDNGNTETILTAVKSENPRAFAKIVDEYLPILAKVDEKAYHHVLGNTIKHTIMAMVQEGRKSGNEALQSAAQIVNQFVFGSSEFSPPSKLVNDKEDNSKENTERKELENQRLEHTRERFEGSRDDLNTKVSNTLKATIDGNIDPKDTMGAYIKKNASREAMEELTSIIDKDTRFKVILDKLWEHAFKNNFNKESTDRIRSAYLSKAKTLLPTVIKKARNEALKGMGKRVREDSDEHEEVKSPEKKEQPRSRESSGKTIKSAKDIPAGMKSIDFLMQD